MSHPRYAIYLAPPVDAPLWAFGSKVLGHDAATGKDLQGFAPRGIDPAAWRRITMRPRQYGFHATLKAPFHLAAGKSLEDLQCKLSAFAAARDAFDLGPLAVTAIADGSGHGFAALTQTLPSAPLAELEMATVCAFDDFRSPMTAADRAARRPERLSPRQRDALDRFGYPFVGPDFRFHMTLTGEVADVHDIADMLADAMANEIGTAFLKVDALVLFEQPESGANFRIIQRADMRESD
jgi:2'-5' RNA ligase